MIGLLMRMLGVSDCPGRQYKRETTIICSFTLINENAFSFSNEKDFRNGISIMEAFLLLSTQRNDPGVRY